MKSPQTHRIAARRGAVCLLAAMLLPGCAITAPATAWRPAEIDVQGMHRLAVLDFNGESGASVAAALTTRLWENQFYSLVDQSELQAVRMASATAPENAVEPAAYLDSARTREVDGIVVGDVVELRCDDQILTSTDVHLGTHHSQNPSRGVSSDGVDVELSQNQTLHREATVSVAFRLVEVSTGQVRATRKTTRSFQGDFDAGQGPIPARGDVLDQLTQQCIDEFVAMLAPHEVELRFPLARASLFQRGQALVGKGNDFARRGRWDEAILAWREALEINQSNDAALYNLAIAQAARHDYTRAEELAIQAVNLKHKDLYADGLERIRGLASDHEQTLQQRQQSQLLPAAHRGRQLLSSFR